jgi:hypothetical protein
MSTQPVKTDKFQLILLGAILFFGLNSLIKIIKFDNPNTDARIILILFLIYYLYKYRKWIKEKIFKQ